MTQALSSADISFYSLEISKFCYIKKYGYRLHFGIYFLILLTFLEPLKIFLMNLAIILLMSGKMAIPGFLNIAVF